MKAKNDPFISKERGPKLTLYHNGLSFRVGVAQIATNSIDMDMPLICPRCGKKLVVTTELIQYGPQTDKHTYSMLCKRCLVGYLYNHHFDRTTEGEESNG